MRKENFTAQQIHPFGNSTHSIFFLPFSPIILAPSIPISLIFFFLNYIFIIFLPSPNSFSIITIRLP